MSEYEFDRLAWEWLTEAERAGHPLLAVIHDRTTGAVWMTLTAYPMWPLNSASSGLSVLA